MSSLGAAVVGLGVGEQHARAFASTPGVRLRWVCDSDNAIAARVTAALRPELGAAADLGAILADPETHIVSIATYDDQHFEQTLAAIRAGKHVFCEKPLCRSLQEATALKRALAEAQRNQLACNLVLRGAPLYSWLKRAIADGEFGAIYAFDGDYLYGRLQKITDGWRKDVRDYSVMQGGGIHLVDLMMWLIAEKPTHTSAVGNDISTEGTAFRYPDFVAATYHFSSGLVGRITANFGCVHRHQHVLRIFGTKRTFIYDDAGPRLHLSRDPNARPRPVELAPVPASKGELIGPFVRAIIDGRTHEPMAQHELDVVAACVAADQALAEGRPIAIEYP